MKDFEKFGKFLLNKIKPFYVRVVNESITQELGIEKVCKPVEYYLYQIFNNYVIIQNALSQLENIKNYLSTPNFSMLYKDSEIKELDFYEYHIENFHIKLVSIMDYVTILVNHSLRLGIPIKKCNVHSVSENTLYNKSPIIKKLKKFEQEFKDFKLSRNIIIHQGNFKSVLTEDLYSHIIISSFDFENDFEEKLQIDKRKKIIETIEVLNAEINKMEEYLGKIMNDLIPEIENKIIQLKLEK